MSSCVALRFCARSWRHLHGDPDEGGPHVGGVGRPVHPARAVQRVVVPHRSRGEHRRQHHAARHPRGARSDALERR